MKISKKDFRHSAEDKMERFLFASRWILSPMYIILVLILALILFRFVGDVVHFIQHMYTFSENEWIIEVLKLLDLTLVANLVLIVAISGYENFVSKIDIAERHRDRLSWMGRLDFSGLKLKIISSVVAISLIELLQDFLKLSFDPNVEFWRIIIHLTFVLTGVVFAGIEILTEKRHELQNKDKFTEIKY